MDLSRTGWRWVHGLAMLVEIYHSFDMSGFWRAYRLFFFFIVWAPWLPQRRKWRAYRLFTFEREILYLKNTRPFSCALEILRRLWLCHISVWWL